MNKSIFFIFSISIGLLTFPIQRSNGLNCFVGDSGNFVSQACSADSNFCKKSDTYTNEGIKSTKGCSLTCENGIVGPLTTSCCSTNNCNSSTSIISSLWLMLFSLLSAIWFKFQ
ncbi:unnamed protein product [Brachionus calyciflorus]|uniref:Uncharacterized protein n=1 Tax=Brachionus calyciflorus TaxID=104777 RepID=A0A813XSN5_9BILA|nr:unnamed protein product [Brachionus calyciflorus]